MSYTIKVMRSGLIKSGIIENDNVVSRKIWKGETLEVEQIHKVEMDDGFYLVVRKKIISPNQVNPAIKRKRQSQNVDQMTELTSLIGTMNDVIIAANKILNKYQKQEEPEQLPIVQSKVQEKEQQSSKELIFDQNGDVPKEFIIDEGEEPENFYGPEEHRESNIRVTELMRNSAGIGFSEDRTISKFADWENKKVPTVSQANIGKEIQVEEEVRIVIPKKQAASSKVQVVTDSEGKIDVVKSLGLNIVNSPSADLGF